MRRIGKRSQGYSKLVLRLADMSSVKDGCTAKIDLRMCPLISFFLSDVGVMGSVLVDEIKKAHTYILIGRIRMFLPPYAIVAVVDQFENQGFPLHAHSK